MVDAPDDGGGRSSLRKSASAYRTISEVSEDLAVPQHVLRFWETKFNQVRPLKRGGGRRYYRPEDVNLLRRIQKLLYEDGYTIKGVQKLLKETRSAAAAEARAEKAAAPSPRAPAEEEPPAAPTPELTPDLRQELRALLTELRTIAAQLRS
jgi:DNA-binding transcriptional MerR regulator